MSELPSSVTPLVAGDTTFYLVGTAHVSARSVAEVREVIAAVKPDVVCVELCKARYEALTKDSAFRDLDVIKVVREGRALALIGHLALAAYQKRLGASLNIKPGAELLAAVQAAEAAGIPVVLIDRDITITLQRTWRNLSVWKRGLLAASLAVGFLRKAEPITEASVEDLKETKALSEMLTELARVLPEVKTPLIDERDHYMASMMADASLGVRRVVAVVGAAHVPGMMAQFGEAGPLPIDRAALEHIPPPAAWWRALKAIVPILFVAALVWSWWRSEHASFAHLMLAWIVPTSAGAGALTLLAGGSILSALTAIAVSPITAIHPLLGTGMLVGVVEAWWRKPTNANRDRLTEDIQSFKGFRRNPVTRILLVALASGIGTAIGFWVGVGWVATVI